MMILDLGPSKGREMQIPEYPGQSTKQNAKADIIYTPPF